MGERVLLLTAVFSGEGGELAVGYDRFVPLRQGFEGQVRSAPFGVLLPCLPDQGVVKPSMGDESLIALADGYHAREPRPVDGFKRTFFAI